MLRITRFGAAVATSVALAVGAVACTNANASSAVINKAKKTGKLAIGIKYDQPGLGLKRPDGTVSGLAL